MCIRDRLYTNAPYYLHWGGSTGVFHDAACTSIVFDTSNYPPFVNTTDFYRYAANPVPVSYTHLPL